MRTNRYPQTGDDITLEPAFNSKLPAQRIYNDFVQVVRSNPNDTQQLLDKLWGDVWNKGGVLLRTSESIYNVNIGHLNVLSAIIYYGRRGFILVDPEYTRHRLLWFGDLKKLVIEAHQFDFFEFTQ